MEEPKNIHEAAGRIEKVLELPTGFLSSLHDEDDWSFVVKLHSLVESACTYLLVTATERPELEEIFSRLEIANKATGKIAFIKELNLLDTRIRAFIHALASLRNDVVHDVKNLATFSFSNYVDNLDKQRLENVLKALYGELETPGQDKRKLLRQGIKFMFWLNAINCLANIHIVKRKQEFKQDQRKALVDFAEKFAGLRSSIIKDMIKQSF